VYVLVCTEIPSLLHAGYGYGGIQIANGVCISIQSSSIGKYFLQIFIACTSALPLRVIDPRPEATPSRGDSITSAQDQPHHVHATPSTGPLLVPPHIQPPRAPGEPSVKSPPTHPHNPNPAKNTKTCKSQPPATWKWPRHRSISPQENTQLSTLALVAAIPTTRHHPQHNTPLSPQFPLNAILTKSLFANAPRNAARKEPDRRDNTKRWKGYARRRSPKPRLCLLKERMHFDSGVYADTISRLF